MPRPRVPWYMTVVAVGFGLLVLSTFTWLAAAFLVVLPLWYLVSHNLYERIVGILSEIACAWTFPTFQKYSLVDCFSSGEQIAFPSQNEKAIVMFNHQSWCDVPILNAYLFFQDVMSRALWVGWNGLSKFPFAWAGMLRGDVWIPCRWPSDKPYLDRSIEQLLSSDMFHLYCFFPEGALKHRNSMAKCHAYCEENGFPKLQYLLWPRNRAFVYVVEKMRKNPAAKYVYDYTVAYEGFGEGRAPGILDLFTRHSFTTKVHIHGRKFLLADLPTGEDALAAWINNLYIEKDQLLKFFWQNGTFPSNVHDAITVSLPASASELGSRLDVDAPRASMKVAAAKESSIESSSSSSSSSSISGSSASSETQAQVRHRLVAAKAAELSKEAATSWKKAPLHKVDYRHSRSILYAGLFFCLNGGLLYAASCLYSLLSA
ncbi:hypothetical protein CAOG_02607 [Capsaspora owczarzaki ATCC 30864]|uniref:Phospholipid/glycerol acyltransferase domain-containing protein n=1 Tax=Capsaspora owczarzaki (strain ATCC 30864) TaxID=595528 RepID=A0A0D2VMQ6_CAPO3|nr:hypothetical protein CAOG_02607 [Capsaspora owczarzaki ATCC 30864]KJE91477.1 hypothetical protein CAOG_002607 [Capsaspora owczarzaki ATCC 30864]|eukprot:XP_004349357.1 hypothetical protein CAOG_02607 [Capsaspora owczarzaki ATCC 30864]